MLVKSLARPTSRCRRTELIVSLERGVCSCAKLQVFLVTEAERKQCQAMRNMETLAVIKFFFLQGKAPKEIHALLRQTLGEQCHRGWKEESQATHVISTTWRRELSPSFSPARLGTKGNSRHSETNIRGTCTITCHCQKLGGQLKRGDFSTCDMPRPGRHKTVTTPESIDQLRELILEDRRISVKSVAEKLGISRERVGSIIHEDLDMRKLSAKWVPKYLNTDQKRQRCQSSEKIWNFSARFKWFPVATGVHGRNLVISLWPGDKAIINEVQA